MRLSDTGIAKKEYGNDDDFVPSTDADGFYPH